MKSILSKILVLLVALAHVARGESMLQYFNTTWQEIETKMPELAEAGYEALWLPPPTKASGGLSVGYDLWDRFDLGSKDQRGTVGTRYGTEAELLSLMRAAHRFGIRIYFDNIMNHNAFDIPAFNESTPIDVYPGFVPEDFHLRLTEEGFYRKWDNTRSWGDAWQVMNLGLSDLIDIAQEPGEWNHNFGFNEGDRIRKIRFVRHPQDPGYYCYKPTAPGQKHSADQGQYVGFGPGNGLTAAFLAANPDYYAELPEDILQRAVRWKLDRTRADGLRLDAVKHVQDDFFGASGVGKESSNYGYTGQAQAQFNLSRGFSDWGNHRDTVFDTEKSRDDAMMFGEHLGQPPGYGGYIDRGMRLVDNDLRSNFNNLLENPSTGLQGYDQPGSGGFGPGIAVTHAQSHDSDYAARRELQHAFYFTRAGLPLVYTDGNYQAETLSQSGGAFPRHANTAFLGQFGDNRLPNLMHLHQNFARGGQKGAWSSADLVAYERIDRRTGASNDAAGAVGLVLINDNFANGVGENFTTSFPPGAHLWQYARGAAANNQSMNGFYITLGDGGGGRGSISANLSNSNGVIVPPGGYYVFSWKNPDAAPAWTQAGGRAIEIYQNGGTAVGTVTVERKDGPDGDPAFNPNGLPDADPTDFKYRYAIPRVTDGSDLKFVVRADGSAENILLRLNGGIDLNGAGSDPAKRDNPPGLATDVFHGYEQPTFVQRMHGEKFAAKDTTRNKLGSAGAETYSKVIGSSGFTITNGPVGSNNYANLGGDIASFLYHDPLDSVGGTPAGGWPGGAAPLQYSEDTSTISLWAKPNGVSSGFRMFCYHTTDGSNPEGAGGSGTGSTRATEMSFSHNQDSNDWWMSATIPKPSSGTFKYKIGIFKNGGVSSWFPGNAASVSRIGAMTSEFAVAGFNAETVEYFPNNDYARVQDPAKEYGDWEWDKQTGLEEGFHVLRARAFIKRLGNLNPLQDGAPIYNTYVQTFYYDAARPAGEFVFPSENQTLGSQNYGVLVRTDRSVKEVWYQISDSEAANDDSQTGVLNGNGSGFEPFTDNNNNGTRDSGEAFEDLNGNGIWNNNLAGSWVKATPAQAGLPANSNYPLQWRFDYRNIPSSGSAQIKVRLKEISSGSDNSLSDVDGHYTTLVRNVNTAGPVTRLFVAYPQADGNTVGEDYILKAYFTKNLGQGVSDAQLIDEFLASIASSVSGNGTNAQPQPRSSYQIIRDETADYHALAFPIPALYNGDPDFLHHLGITHTRSNVTLAASRVVRAAISETPYIAITNPPALGSDGRLFEVVLPALAAPTPDDRAFSVRVATDSRVMEVTLVPEIGGGVVNFTAMQESGSSKIWEFRWSGLDAGNYRLRADAKLLPGGPVAATARRDVTVVIRQVVPEDPSNNDDDDDGIPDSDELTRKALPTSNSETWTNGDVHIWRIAGASNPVSPDTDDDLLTDGLESGIAAPFNEDTNTTTDTDGDGFPNFIADIDPPIFNTTDNWAHPRYDFNRSRSDQIGGSMTDPTRPDTDNDNLRDSSEDLNRNGRVDIALLDGNGVAASVIASPVTVYNSSRADRAALPTHARFLETDPNHPDTDGDGVADGSEDPNTNGRVDLQIIASAGSPPENLDLGAPSNSAYLIGSNLSGVKSRAIDRAALNAAFPSGGYPRVVWLETDPLNPDTDGDGLPDGWEITNGLDSLDGGVISLRTGGPGDPNQGANGDPDGDGFSNLQELQNGTKPLVFDGGEPPPANSIVIGPGETVTRGLAVNHNDFTDWTIDDLVAFDEYQGEGTNNQGGDVYRAWDGFDSSRDIVAFYARDGGADGSFYFRLDMQDLRPQAEEGNLNIYVVIDTGNPASGEAALPDEVDILTEMRWEAVVACDQSDSGRVSIDTNAAVNSTTINETLAGANGVVVRDQNSANGFGRAYFNHELDAAEFSISRQALLDAGWNGISKLNYQVFTTRGGNNNSGPGGPGPGDIGGRNDIRDTITDDWLAEDNGSAQANIASNGRLNNWLGADTNGLYPDQRKSAKMILLTHGHQPVLPGAETQNLINSGFNTGYHRLVDGHEAFGQPLSLHLTPTLASAIQWAAADPAANKPWRDGPAFNQRLAAGMDSGNIELLGTTFSDHMIAYFSNDYNSDSTQLADEVMQRIYQKTPSSRVFWNPERVADGSVFQRVAAMGYSHTFIDQMRHLFKWQGRNTALSDDGYRLNRYHGVTSFVINDQAGSYRFQNLDNGFPNPWRNLFHRKARSGTQDQVVVIQNWWEEFSNADRAAAYDRNLRWAANKPWIRIVTPEEIIDGAVDINRDGSGDPWYVIERGSPLLPKVSHDWIDHATQENYDNWYLGQPGREEGLLNKVFEIRPGTPLPPSLNFGMQTLADGKLADLSWNAVKLLGGSPRLLARATAHTATALTAFHNQQNNDLSKYSTGAYTNPDTDFNPLSTLAKRSQSQMRFAAIYSAVEAWAANPPSNAQALALDVDLDGEPEYLLENDRVFAVFEALGGRMTAAWARDPVSGRIHQVAGNFLAYNDSETEAEGIANHDGAGGTGARRTSGFKDWFAVGASADYVNALYQVAAAGSNGWSFTSPDGAIAKTISLGDLSNRLRASYALAGDATSLFIRFGLSPHLEDLFTSGQANLLSPSAAGGVKEVSNQNADHSVTAALRCVGPGLAGAVIQEAATDGAPSFTPDTVPMRNQALTEQVEVHGTSTAFTFELELIAENADVDGDGLPDDWERLHQLSTSDNGFINIDNGPNGDPDLDGMTNIVEWLVGLNPRLVDHSNFPKLSIERIAGGFRLSFPTLPGRTYQVQSSVSLGDWMPFGEALTTLPTAAPGVFQIDDTTGLPTRFYRMLITRAN
jgi:glycosidase